MSGCVTIDLFDFKRTSNRLHMVLEFKWVLGTIDCIDVLHEMPRWIHRNQSNTIYWMHQTINEMFSKKVVPRTERVCYYRSIWFQKDVKYDYLSAFLVTLIAVITWQCNHTIQSFHTIYWMHQTTNEMFSKKVIPRTERVCWLCNRKDVK